MIKNFYYRFLFVVTFITGFLFICSVPEVTDMINWILLGCIFSGLYWVTYRSFKDLSKERIDEILYIDFFKKIGYDFSEE